MAKVMITESYLEDIADAIREKKGGSDTYTPGEMAEAISSIDGGSTIDMPTFTETWSNDWETLISVTCDKTLAECLNYIDNGLIYASLTAKTQDGSEVYEHTTFPKVVATGTQTITYTYANSGVAPYADIVYTSDGITEINPSQSRETLNITQNGTYYPTGYDFSYIEEVNVAVPSSAPTLQTITKSYTPTESLQTETIMAESGYDAIEKVNVTIVGIPFDYVGSGIDQRSSSDLTASGATVTVPAGYYENQASKSVSTMTLPTSATSSATSGYTSKATIGRSTSAQYINIPPGYNSAGAYYVISAVANGSASAPSTISDTSATVSTGTNTLTLTKTVSVTPIVSAGYISSGTETNSSVSLTASVTTKAATTITPGTTNQTIASGTYLTGTQTIVGDSDLVGSNILSTANIFGVQGQVVVQNYYTGSSAPSSSLGSNGDLYLQS